jgi:hypothetical protein
MPLAPGEKVPDASTFTSNTVNSTFSTNASSYNKSNAPALLAFTPQAKRDTKGGMFSIPPVMGAKIKQDTDDSVCVEKEDMHSTASNTRTVDIILFAQRLIHDSKKMAGLECISKIPPSELELLLKVFAGRLHEESTTPFGWKASVQLHQGSGYVCVPHT